jgi:ATP-dependent DNA helicase RecG
VIRKQLLAIIADLQANVCELDDLEVKTARGGTPGHLYEDISGFADSAGGVLLFGLDERRGFEVVGVGDAQQLQADLATNAAQLSPQPVMSVSHHLLEGQEVVVAEIDALPPSQRPAHLKSKDETYAWTRVGNSTQRMSAYQVFGYLSARSQPTFDEDAVAAATPQDLDGDRINAFIEQLRHDRPRARFLRSSVEETLAALGILHEVDGKLLPTLGGLLAFGRYPQQFEPQLVITFMQYAGTDEREKGPRGERFLDNQKFDGPIIEMVDQAEAHVMGRIATAARIDGLLRTDIPEYPRPAIREALMNAVAHRDYSGYVRGSQVQVKLFADRLEVHSPGGLFGDVTIETLEERQSTRNRRLMQLLEQQHLVENRGSGINSMIAEMREAHMEPPRFSDDRSSFTVTFFNHTLLLSAEGIDWLNAVASHLQLNERQKLALLYLRHNHRLTNSEYRRLHHGLDSREAGRELQGLVRSGAAVMKGTRGGAFYALALPRETPIVGAPASDEAKVIAYVRRHGFIKAGTCSELLGFDSPQRAGRFLRKLAGRGLLSPEGEKRGRRYLLP